MSVSSRYHQRAKFFSTMHIDCPDCGKRVAAKQLHSYDFTNQIAGGAHVGLQFVICPRCTQGLLFRCEEVWDGAWSEPVLVYPRAPEGLVPGAPGDVLKAMAEAQRCLQASAFSASAMMCRKALEQLCAAHGIQAGNLARSVQQLKDQGVIDGWLYEWADELRIAGNQAAHESGDISGEDARDLFEFTRAIVEYVIVVRDRFERYKQRRKVQPPS